MNEAGKAKIGLLPLMLEMYKEFSPEMLKLAEWLHINLVFLS